MTKISRYIISSYDDRLVEHRPFLKTLKNIKRYWNATPFILPTSARAMELKGMPTTGVRSWCEDNVVTDKLVLNKHLVLMPGMSYAFRQDPTTGFESLDQEKTIVLGGLPRILKTLPSLRFTRQVMTAGSVGRLNPSSQADIAASSGRNWELMSIYARPSALFIEVHEDSNKIFTSYLNWCEKGQCIYDLNKKFTPDSEIPEVYKPLAINVGDTHAAKIDVEAHNATLRYIDFMQPERVCLNDPFDNLFGNHHESAYLYRNTSDYKPSLMEEIEDTHEIIDSYCEWMLGRGIVEWIPSNHEDAVIHYLNNPSKWMNDSRNNKFMSLLYAYMTHYPSVHPIEIAMGLRDFDAPNAIGSLGLKPIKMTRKNFRYILPSEKHIIGGTYVTHGAKFFNGAKGVNIKKASQIVGSMSYMHTHSPGVCNDVTVGGTNSLLNCGYNEGSLSSWRHANTGIHPEGSLQMLDIIDGETRSFVP